MSKQYEVRDYNSKKAMQRGINSMAKRGYEVGEIEKAIEEIIPTFLKYTIIDDPFSPRVHFRFGDYTLALSVLDIERFRHDLTAVVPKLEEAIPNDYMVIWRYLLTGETDAQVYDVERGESTIDVIEFEEGIHRSHTLDYFPLRNGPMWAAYVDDLNILAIWFENE